MNEKVKSEWEYMCVTVNENYWDKEKIFEQNLTVMSLKCVKVYIFKKRRSRFLLTTSFSFLYHHHKVVTQITTKTLKISDSFSLNFSNVT